MAFSTYKAALQSSGVSAQEDNIISDEIELRFKKNAAQNTLRVSPNPGNGNFLVNLASEEGHTIKTLRVMNVTGQIIVEADVNSPFYRLDLTQQSHGVYYLQAFDSETWYYQKLIIQ